MKGSIKVLSLFSVLAIALAAVISALSLIIVPPGGVEAGAVIYVPHDYTTIQEAVNNASPGDTIIVRDGVYEENIDVGKSLTIQSENGTATTIVKAKSSADHVFEVTAGSVSISGFWIKEADTWPYAGIYLMNADGCNIASNKVTDNSIGISFQNSANNVITNNLVKSNSVAGIYLIESDNNTFEGNEIRDSGKVGVGGWGIILGPSAESNVFRYNTLYHNHCEVTSALSATNNRLYLNNFTKGTDPGDVMICAYFGDNMWNTPEKMIYKYGGSTFTNYLGNYWSDYTGSDADSDGIGDTPYSISGDSDNYPLMQPFQYYEVLGPAPPPERRCFIATAAYGTETAQELDILKAFRDEVLLQNSLGSRLVSFYYEVSPPLADFISEHETVRTLVRELLVDPLVGVVEAVWRD